MYHQDQQLLENTSVPETKRGLEKPNRVSILAQRSLRCSPLNTKGFFTLNAVRNKIQVFIQMCALIQNFSLTFQKYCSFSQKPRSIQLRTQMIVLFGKRKTKTNTSFVFPLCFIVDKSGRERKPSSLNVFPMLINRSDRSLMGKGGTPAQWASPTGISIPFQKFWLPTDKTGPSTKNKAQSVRFLPVAHKATGAKESPRWQKPLDTAAKQRNEETDKRHECSLELENTQPTTAAMRCFCHITAFPNLSRYS